VSIGKVGKPCKTIAEKQTTKLALYYKLNGRRNTSLTRKIWMRVDEVYFI
jgi:hypothetical protein